MGRDPRRSLVQPLAQSRVSYGPDQITQGFVLLVLENLQCQSLHNLSGQPLVSSFIQSEFFTSIFGCWHLFSSCAPLCIARLHLLGDLPMGPMGLLLGSCPPKLPLPKAEQVLFLQSLLAGQVLQAPGILIALHWTHPFVHVCLVWQRPNLDARLDPCGTPLFTDLHATH